MKNITVSHPCEISFELQVSSVKDGASGRSNLQLKAFGAICDICDGHLAKVKGAKGLWFSHIVASVASDMSKAFGKNFKAGSTLLRLTEESMALLNETMQQVASEAGTKHTVSEPKDFNTVSTLSKSPVNFGRLGGNNPDNALSYFGFGE